MSASALRLPICAAREGLVVVGMADLGVSARADERLITYALGSCLGIALHDPVAGVGGLLHVMLPDSKIDAEKARANPYMFVDTGVPLLFRRCYELGARKERCIVKVAGGAFAGTAGQEDRFQIGKRNFIALRQLLWKNGVMLQANETGGLGASRTMWLDVGSGAVGLKVNGGAEVAL